MSERDNEGSFDVINLIGKSKAPENDKRDQTSPKGKEYESLDEEIDALIDRLQQIYLWENTFDEI